MRVLGIDPGIAKTGWGTIKIENGKLKVENYGCIETDSRKKPEERLSEIYTRILNLIDKYKPSEIALEELFFNTNAKTAFIVGQARGVVLLAGAERKLSIGIYTPLQVKIAVTGYGRAEKNQMGIMVKNILKLKTVPKPDDTADALAVALTHVFSRKMERKI